MSWNNDCRFIGNITHPPYYRRVGPSEVPFLRFYLAVDTHQDEASFVRVVAYGDVAAQTWAYLQVGSKVLVQARYRQRKRQDNEETVHEFVADHIVFIDKIDWAHGEALRSQLLAERDGAESARG